jgi:hypothetical protein
MPGWHFPYLSFATHRKSAHDPKDYSQRTRSFLHASLGAVIANGLHIDTVGLADNGVISLNLPINDQLLGSRASRSTHPKFLSLFTELAALIFTSQISVENPLWSRTRVETLEVLKSANLRHLIEAARSCSHTRALTALQPHCGTCSQCIDRRFATARAGLEEYDPGERYRLDILRQDLPAGDARTMVLSYVRFAQRISEMDGEEMFRHFPQLWDAIEPQDSNQRVFAEALTSMMRRHGQGVVAVLQQRIEQHSGELALGRLPQFSLLRVLQAPTVGTAVTPKRRSDEFWHSDDYRSVGFGERTITLPPNPALIVRRLHEAAKTGTPNLSWGKLAAELQLTARSMSAAFQKVPDWRSLIETRGRGIYGLRLAAEAKTSAA